MTELRHLRTQRLVLDAPSWADLDALHAINADPRVWTHHPSLRHVDPAQTEAMVGSWIESWVVDGLGPWTVRRPGEPMVLGHGGCALRGGGLFWNLGYRFAPEAQGHGYATEVAAAAVAAAQRLRPDVPVVAYLLEHNEASARVAERVGLTLRHRAPDAGNPDAAAVRLVHADRPLTASQLAAALH